MSYLATYARSVGKIATEMSNVAAYVYHKMIFWRVIQLNCHLIQHVTLMYSHTTCLNIKIWSYIITFNNFVNYFYKDYHITSSSYNDQVTSYDDYITPCKLFFQVL